MNNKTKNRFYELLNDLREDTPESIVEIFKRCALRSPDKRANFRDVINLFSNVDLELKEKRDQKTKKEFLSWIKAAPFKTYI